MTLQERIRDCRRRAGLSQEQLAERLGVSRQAVAKWEAGRSAPSTERLLKLAGVLQVELTQLVPPEDFGENDPDGAASQAEAGRPEWRERLRWAALTAGAYLALFLLGRLLWGRREGYSLLGWLTSWQSELYVFGWLLSSRLFWLAMGISVLAALAGRVRLAGTSLAAMPLGIFLGELLGPFPEGAPLGHGQVDLERWDRELREHRTVVAWEDGLIVGFGDMDKTGYLDRLFVHKDFQGRGIATAICDALEGESAAPRLWVQASLTARPFFEGRGYRVVKAQQVERRGVLLPNFVMEKLRDSI